MSNTLEKYLGKVVYLAVPPHKRVFEGIVEACDNKLLISYNLEGSDYPRYVSRWPSEVIVGR